MQALVDEVSVLFASLAWHNWLSWCAELLFTDLQEQVEHEECEAEAARVWEQEEEVCWVAEEVWSTKIDTQKAALAKVCAEVLDRFWAKTVLKEELC